MGEASCAFANDVASVAADVAPASVAAAAGLLAVTGFDTLRVFSLEGLAAKVSAPLLLAMQQYFEKYEGHMYW